MPHANSLAENVFGTIGTICWTGQLIPQVWKSWREKSTSGLSPWLVLIWGFASVFLGVYVVVQRLNIPLMVQPQLFGFLSFISWGQCQYYEKKRTRRTTILMTLALIVLSGVLEFILIIVIRPLKNARSKDIATAFFGILSTVLISVALFPQYWEIYKHKAVIGISLTFITIDMLGGVFNDLSLVFKEKFDVIAAVSYSLVVVLDAVILVAAAIFGFLSWRHKRKGAEATEPESQNDAISQQLTIVKTASRLEDKPTKDSWVVTTECAVEKSPGRQSPSEYTRVVEEGR